PPAAMRCSKLLAEPPFEVVLAMRKTQFETAVRFTQLSRVKSPVMFGAGTPAKSFTPSNDRRYGADGIPVPFQPLEAPQAVNPGSRIAETPLADRSNHFMIEHPAPGNVTPSTAAAASK